MVSFNSETNMILQLPKWMERSGYGVERTEKRFFSKGKFKEEKTLRKIPKTNKSQKP